jgi:hypothetical protein
MARSLNGITSQTVVLDLQPYRSRLVADTNRRARSLRMFENVGQCLLDQNR